MAFVSIFDLCDWDIYVGYASNGPASPNSNDYLVHMDDFDPAVGSITIVGGEIVMDMAFNPSGGGGLAPYVVAVPKAAHPGGAVRMTYTEGRGTYAVDEINVYQSGGVTLDWGSEWLENGKPKPNPLDQIASTWSDDVATINVAGELEPSAAIAFVCVQKGF